MSGAKIQPGTQGLLQTNPEMEGELWIPIWDNAWWYAMQPNHLSDIQLTKLSQRKIGPGLYKMRRFSQSIHYNLDGIMLMKGCRYSPMLCFHLLTYHTLAQSKPHPSSYLSTNSDVSYPGTS